MLKVECSQKTDLQEFYAIVDLADPELESKFQEWQHHYNWDRQHGSLNGNTPMEKYFDLSRKTPFRDEVEAAYNSEKERIQEPNYWLDQQVKKLKRCL
jgi:hypothetical protein